MLAMLIALYMVIGGLAVGLAVACVRLQGTPWRGRALSVGLAVVPPVVMLVLFYSLAVHMHRDFDGWPSSIGEAGFSEELSRHAHYARYVFGVVLLFSTFAWPVLCTLVLGIGKLRRFQPATVSFGATTLACFALMLLGPGDFLYWWWD